MEGQLTSIFCSCLPHIHHRDNLPARTRYHDQDSSGYDDYTDDDDDHHQHEATAFLASNSHPSQRSPFQDDLPSPSSPYATQFNTWDHPSSRFSARPSSNTHSHRNVFARFDSIHEDARPVVTKSLSDPMSSDEEDDSHHESDSDRHSPGSSQQRRQRRRKQRHSQDPGRARPMEALELDDGDGEDNNNNNNNSSNDHNSNHIVNINKNDRQDSVVARALSRVRRVARSRDSVAWLDGDHEGEDDAEEINVHSLMEEQERISRELAAQEEALQREEEATIVVKRQAAIKAAERRGLLRLDSTHKDTSTISIQSPQEQEAREPSIAEPVRPQGRPNSNSNCVSAASSFVGEMGVLDQELVKLNGTSSRNRPGRVDLATVTATSTATTSSSSSSHSEPLLQKATSTRESAQEAVAVTVAVGHATDLDTTQTQVTAGSGPTAQKKKPLTSSFVGAPTTTIATPLATAGQNRGGSGPFLGGYSTAAAVAISASAGGSSKTIAVDSSNSLCDDQVKAEADSMVEVEARAERPDRDDPLQGNGTKQMLTVETSVVHSSNRLDKEVKSDNRIKLDVEEEESSSRVHKSNDVEEEEEGEDEDEGDDDGGEEEEDDEQQVPGVEKAEAVSPTSMVSAPLALAAAAPGRLMGTFGSILSGGSSLVGSYFGYGVQATLPEADTKMEVETMSGTRGRLSGLRARVRGRQADDESDVDEIDGYDF